MAVEIDQAPLTRFRSAVGSGPVRPILSCHGGSPCCDRLLYSREELPASKEGPETPMLAAS
jgi:hypothetical protein